MKTPEFLLLVLPTFEYIQYYPNECLKNGKKDSYSVIKGTFLI